MGHEGTMTQRGHQGGGKRGAVPADGRPPDDQGSWCPALAGKLCGSLLLPWGGRARTHRFKRQEVLAGTVP